MSRIIVALAFFICAATAGAQLMQPLLIGGSGGIVISITACGSNTCSYAPGTTNPIGQAVAILSNGSKYSGSWSSPVTGVDHTGAACPNNSADFTISSTGLLSSTVASTSQTSVCIATLGKTPYVQLVALTPSSSMACGPASGSPAGSLTTFSGTAPTEAANAGFNTCVVNFTWSNSFYATQSNWLDCNNNNPGLIWHKNYFGANTNGPCSDIALVTDGANTVLEIPWKGATYDITVAAGMVTSCPCGGWANVPSFYLEGIWRVDAVTSNSNPGGSTQFWTWQSPTNGFENDPGELFPQDNGFADQAIHDWTVGPPNGVGGWCCTPPNPVPGGYSLTTYHKYGYLWTSDGASSMIGCGFVDDVLQFCQTLTMQLSGGPISFQYTEKSFLLGTASAPPGGFSYNFLSQYARVFSCTSWETTMCNGTSLVTGAGGLTYWKH